MKIAALIAEYNPFHKGHAYHITRTARLTSCDYCIVIMSGNYVQRGAPAIFSKRVRTAMALACGADLVLELPLAYSCASANHFARGAVSIVNALGCVDYLSFGCEDADKDMFDTIGNILSKEPPLFKEILQKSLKEGLSFPAARQKAILFALQKEGMSKKDCARLSSFFSSPNNLLGLEYIKILKETESRTTPILIKRQGAGYHDKRLDSAFISASGLREAIFLNYPQNFSMEDFKEFVPSSSYKLYQEEFAHRGPLCPDDFSLLLKYRLMSLPKELYSSYLDVSPFLAKKIAKHLNDFTSWTQFCHLLKSKDLTFGRIQRSLLHILLQIEQPYDLPYLRVLGFRRKSAPLLSKIKETASLPLLSKLPKETTPCLTSSKGGDSLGIQILADNLYESVLSMKYGSSFVHERARSIVISD